jgi:methyl-accepting chemotaxis protein
MRWETNNGFYEDNKDYVHTFIIIMAVCLVGVWLCYDYYRNEPIYNDTDTSVERLEKRLDDIGQRIDSLQKRVVENQKAVERITGTVTAGRENAEAVANGLGEAERRLDNAIQASGRIQNRIEEIERANRQRTQSSPQTDLAK